MAELALEENQIHILVVDDNPSIVDILTRILSDKGYLVSSCSDGEDCWNRLMTQIEEEGTTPDLLLLDLMLPGLDGLTILRRLRADQRFSRMPVIILTVRDESEVMLKALEAGANDYITKPFQTVELVTRVENFLNWRMAERFQQERMEYLIQAGQVLLSTLDLDRVLQHVMEIAMEGLEAEGASIWMRDEGGGLVCAAVSGRSADRLLNMNLPPGQGIAGWTLRHAQSTLVPDVEADSRFYRDVSAKIGFHTRDLIAAPLLLKDRGIGVLEAVNKRDGTFSPADLAWMEVLASMAAASIANARLFKTLRRRTIELQTHNEELDAFAHTVAHDLKNPLSLILGYSETLQADYQDLPADEMKKHLSTIARMSKRMDTIIEELLLLAQVRKMDVEMRPLDMGAIVDAALEQLSYDIEKHQAEIIQPDEWPVALGYGPWVEEIWVNYIHNAIKYGGQPPRVKLGATVASNERSYFWVYDNGSGLTEEEQEQLFTPFTELKQVRSEGHGLGLSIVRRIVEKLDGKVGVKSEVGQGSLFYFSLPR
jgi:signal transduction histidine kinase